jgi:hypothetical protein
MNHDNQIAKVIHHRWIWPGSHHRQNSRKQRSKSLHHRPQRRETPGSRQNRRKSQYIPNSMWSPCKLNLRTSGTRQPHPNPRQHNLTRRPPARRRPHLQRNRLHRPADQQRRPNNFRLLPQRKAQANPRIVRRRSSRLLLQLPAVRSLDPDAGHECFGRVCHFHGVLGIAR